MVVVAVVVVIVVVADGRVSVAILARSAFHSLVARSGSAVASAAWRRRCRPACTETMKKCSAARCRRSCLARPSVRGGWPGSTAWSRTASATFRSPSSLASSQSRRRVGQEPRTARGFGARVPEAAASGLPAAASGPGFGAASSGGLGCKSLSEGTLCIYGCTREQVRKQCGYNPHRSCVGCAPHAPRARAHRNPDMASMASTASEQGSPKVNAMLEMWNIGIDASWKNKKMQCSPRPERASSSDEGRTMMLSSRTFDQRSTSFFTWIKAYMRRAWVRKHENFGTRLWERGCPRVTKVWWRRRTRWSAIARSYPVVP